MVVKKLDFKLQQATRSSRSIYHVFNFSFPSNFSLLRSLNWSSINLYQTCLFSVSLLMNEENSLTNILNKHDLQLWDIFLSQPSVQCAVKEFSWGQTRYHVNDRSQGFLQRTVYVDPLLFIKHTCLDKYPKNCITAFVKN